MAQPLHQHHNGFGGEVRHIANRHPCRFIPSAHLQQMAVQEAGNGREEQNMKYVILYILILIQPLPMYFEVFRKFIYLSETVN